MHLKLAKEKDKGDEMRRISILVGVVAVLAVGLAAKDVWVRKDFSKWSDREVNRVLDDSPWGKTYQLTSRTPFTEYLQRRRADYYEHLGVHIRFLTAKPVRLALVRKLILSSNGDLDASRFENFIQQPNPDRIIVTLSLGSKDPQQLNEALSQLKNSNLSAFANNTFLQTKSGKKVFINRFEPPDERGLGARLYFPRRLPDGQPLATVDDGQILFQTEGLREEIRQWFKLRPMVFEGQLEI